MDKKAVFTTAVKILTINIKASYRWVCNQTFETKIMMV